MPKHILVEREGRVGLITLNRPQAMNALSSALMRELGAALADFERDDGIGAIVLTGNDKAFAAGADIAEMQGKTYLDAYKEDFITADWEDAARCRKPLIAAVAGYALGGGCELAMMCDFIIAPTPRSSASRKSTSASSPAPAARNGYARGRQGEGDGDVPDRAHGGRRGGRARRVSRARGAPPSCVTRVEDRRRHRRQIPARGVDVQRIHRPRVRVAAGRGLAVPNAARSTPCSPPLTKKKA